MLTSSVTVSVCGEQGLLYSLIRTFKRVFMECLLYVRVFLRNVPKQTKHWSCHHYLLPYFPNSRNALLSYYGAGSLHIPRRDLFCLLPRVEPIGVVQCTAFINLCGMSAFLDPMPCPRNKAFTYNHVSFAHF